MRCSVTRPSFLWATRCLMARCSCQGLGFGDWGLVGLRLSRRQDQSRSPIPSIPNPQSPIPAPLVRSARGLIDAHAEAQPHRVENLLDLVEALSAEVLRLQHLRLGLVHELADGADVRVLQAV